MPKISQITADLGDDPEALRGIVDRLAAASIALHALSLEGSRLRIVVADPERALGLLGEAGVEAWLGEALAIDVGERAEAVARPLERLRDGGIEVLAAYTGSARPGGGTMLVLTVSDLEAARRCLGE